MNSSVCAAQVIQVLRDSSLSGSDREINVHESLGELGLGLDSLALLQFVLALENKFGIVIPESIWTERGQLTVRDFIELVAAASEGEEPPGAAQPPAPASPEGWADKRSVTTGDAAQEIDQSPVKRSKAFRRMRRIMSFVFSRRRLIILEFPLRTRPLPTHASSLKLELRVASESEAGALCAYWESSSYATIDKKEMNLTLFRRRLESGDVCLVAWHGDRIVGMDWLFARGYDCPYTGLRMEWPSDTCYGGELSEHDDFGGRGIGMALLAYSLAEAKRMGRHRQVATVVATNVKMLGAAVQLYGFTPVGKVQITRLFDRPYSVWRIGTLTGWGGKVTL